MIFINNPKYVTLNLPIFSLKIKQIGENTLVWDKIRLSWLVLTPEEWVRQHIINLLIEKLNFSAQLIKAESKVDVGTKTMQRIDLLCYDSEHRPRLLVECKATSVKITNETLSQAFRYNSVVGAPFVLLSNGLEHYIFEKNSSGEYIQLSDIRQIANKVY